MFNYLARKRRVQLQKGIRRSEEKKRNRIQGRTLRHETLEDRRLLTLLGVGPLERPTIDFDSGGTTVYNSASNVFSIHATPLEADMVAPVPGELSPNESLFYFGTLDINIIVDESGSLVGGVPGDDLVLIGDLDVDFDFSLDYSSLDGPLLTGEIVAFGHQDSGGTTDQYDFEFVITGGQLAGLYPNGRLGISMNSEHSTFIGDFNVPFAGGAKGQIGAIPGDENPGIDIEKLVNGEDADFPEEAVEINPGDPVTFTYQVTNTGNVPYNFNDVLVVDDNGTPDDTGDDLSTASGDLVLVPGSDIGNDGILSPGEQWLYEYTTTAQNLFLDVCGCEVAVYGNTAVVTVPGATDSDQAHYTNPSDAPPCIDYDSGGSVSYDAANDHFSINATPLTTEDGGTFFSGSLSINAIVNGAGVLVGGVPGDDFVLTGELDADGDFNPDYNGVLLTGEIISYLATDSGGTTDTYEFTFVVTGGLLASQYMGMGIKVKTTSENSTYTGDYSVDFGGGAKGEICCICLDTASLSGHKYTDQTGDGFSGDDTPLANVVINLYQDLNGNGTLDDDEDDFIFATDTTDANGEYSFTGLVPGAYIVQEVVPAGYQPTSPTTLAVTLANGDQISTGFDFVNFEKGRITGTKFTDSTGDGISFDDFGLGGVTINLYAGTDDSGPIVDTTVTSADGTFSFNNVAIGTYFVQEVVPIGYEQTDGNAGYVITVGVGGLTSGGIAPGNNFANFQLGSLSGQKFQDNNGDGVKNGADAGLLGWTIELDKDANGTVDATTVTDVNGNYSFTGLTAGTYRVREVGQVGWTQTTVNPGNVSVVSGTNSTGNNFGNFKLGSLSGQKFQDNNGDGIKNGADAGLLGWTIELDKDANGTVDATTVTDVNGNYSFTGLTAGTYRVREVGQVGWTQTTVNPGNVSVVSGTNSTGNNFGNFKLGSLSGQKFQDNNGDGIKNGADAGLLGWTIELDKDANGTVDATTVTDVNGNYSFTGLTAGTYRVREVGQVGWTQTTVNPGNVSVVSGTNSTGNNFGNFKLGSLSGQKFEDNNRDGIKNGADAGLQGWTIQLDKDANGTVDATTVTDVNGNYSFTGLTAGIYRVREVGQAGWIQTTVNPGDVSIVSGTNSTGKNFGNDRLDPGIDIEKTTNGSTNSNPTAPNYDNEDSQNGPGVPILTPGSTVNWTYKVTNTGELPFTFNQVFVTDDSGTPGNAADDMSTTNGRITFHSVQIGDADNILEPGEVWLYKASGIVQDLSASASPAVTFDFSGNTSLDGTDGIVRTFTSGGVSVKTSAFSRDKSTGAWSAAYLGSYSGGLGVTDSSEGSGSNNQHTVDNSGRDNYVLFEFNQSVIVDSAFLGYVVTDSDMTVWIGTMADPFNNHVTLSDAVLAGLGFTEVNLGDASARTADFNAGNLVGNVLVIAAKTGESNDFFKIEKLKTQKGIGYYENKAVVTVPGATDSDLSHYTNPVGVPGIDIEKYTNGVDADTPATAVEIAPGNTVTWTYKVKNTGTLAFTAAQVAVTDDNGTVGNTADDFQPTLIASSDVGNDGILSPGEVWTYTASAIAQDLTVAGGTSTFDFSGNTSLDGTDGIVRTFTSGGVSVKTSAFSRDKSTGAWSAAYLGSYSGGLGVTDSSEGSGSNNQHTVDNSGRDNYVLFEFNQSVIVDSAFLGYVVTDSDMTVWIGTMADPFNNHVTLSDAVLAGLGFTEVNLGDASARTADFNAGNLVGNVLVIAAKTGESNDFFKIEKLNTRKPELGVHKNVAKVVAGSVTDTDVSHYKNPECVDILYAFAGNTSTTGTKGNVRSYTTNNVSLNVSAFSRTTSGGWETAYLGAYSDGLGVTDTSENGSSGTQLIDNVGRVNFLLFEFSTIVEIDRVFLDAVSGDSDISVWIGTIDNAYHNHLTLSDSLAAFASYSGTDTTSSSSARWANINPNGVKGNVLVIAAALGETNDQFKISKLEVCAEAVKFFVVDPTSDRTYEYGTAGEALANYNVAAANANARGIATTAAGDKLWVVDGNKVVYVYDADGALLGSWTANGLNTPEDIATNGTDIWIVDDGLNKVFRYSGGSGSGASRLSGSQNAASSFALNSANANAKGIVTDGTHLWVVDDGASVDKVFKYTLSGTLVGSWTIDSNNSSPTGITIDPADVSNIWIVDSTKDAVYRYNGATNRTSGSQAASHVFQLASGNGNAQGIADPPPSAGELSTQTDVFAAVSSLPRKAVVGIQDRALTGWCATSGVEQRSGIRRLVADRFADPIAESASNRPFELHDWSATRGLGLETRFERSVESDRSTNTHEDESDFDWVGSVDAALEDVFS